MKRYSYSTFQLRFFCLRLALMGALVVCFGQACSAAGRPVSDQDIRFLNRITYGVDSVTLAQYRAMGRQRFLESQLVPATDTLPASAQQVIDKMTITVRNAEELLSDAEIENRRINALPDGDLKGKARQAQQYEQERVAFEAVKRHLLRAVYSPAQLKEQMSWFWLNHFSVFRYKANLRWSVADYEEHAIRPYALGNFRDLVMATLKHPAMLIYLDNAQSTAGKINENYARELLELQTMGLGSGPSPATSSYTQQDVQELARVMTGVGVNYGPTSSRVKPELQHLLVKEGAFEFNPARHDFGDKVFLGHKIIGSGLGEVDQVVDIIMQSPATARNISQKLAIEFVSDMPPASLVERMAQAFTRSRGDIPTVLRVMFLISSLRFAYDAQTVVGKTFANLRPANNMLNAMGEGLYGRLTPDGYGLRETDWSSSGQMSKRFEIAKQLGNSNAGLFDPDDGTPAQVTGFPQLSNRFFFDNIEPELSATTRSALGKASAQWEWNAYLLSSPEFMFR
jgi:uncharacterized protein (DUF1800 family)